MVHEILVGDQHAALRVGQVAPAHPVVGFVRNRAEVVPQPHVERQPRIDLPVILEIGGEVPEVEVAGIPGQVAHRESARLEDACVAVVAQQHVRDGMVPVGVAGEEAPEGELTEEVVGQIALE